MGTWDTHKIVLRGGKELEFSEETWKVLKSVLNSRKPPQSVMVRGHYIPVTSILWAGPIPDAFGASEKDEHNG